MRESAYCYKNAQWDLCVALEARLRPCRTESVQRGSISLDPRISCLLLTLESLVTSKDCDVVLSTVAFGILPRLDLPELCAAVGPRPVWLVNSIGPQTNGVPISEIRAAYDPAIQTYSKADREENLSFRVEPDLTDDLVLEWAQKLCYEERSGYW